MSDTCKNFQNPKIAGNWLSIGTPPHFSPNFFFAKMTQNGLKWIFFLKAFLTKTFIFPKIILQSYKNLVETNQGFK